MRKRTLLVAMAGLAVVVTVGAVVLWPRADRVTRANYERIQIGMTRADVEAILGPPGDYTTGPLTDPNGIELLLSLLPPASGVESPWWAADYGTVGVWFDEGGRVVMKNYEPYSKAPQGVGANLLWRAKRQWHRWFPE
jgi:hypothetical protein